MYNTAQQRAAAIGRRAQEVANLLKAAVTHDGLMPSDLQRVARAALMEAGLTPEASTIGSGTSALVAMEPQDDPEERR